MFAIARISFTIIQLIDITPVRVIYRCYNNYSEITVLIRSAVVTIIIPRFSVIQNDDSMNFEAGKFNRLFMHEFYSISVSFSSTTLARTIV